MALKTLSSPLLSTSFHPSLSPQRFTHNARKFTCFANSSLTSNSGQRKEEIVIVGAGIAGLATALALHRLGIQSLVLEQTDGLRTGGTSLTLFKNGWSVLDVLGVGDQLRSQFLQIQGLTLKTDQGKELRSFDFKDVDQSQEVRAVERRVLLQTLASELPSGSVQFSSKLAKIEEDNKTGETKLELTNGAILSAEIVIACDGIRSPIARWMGFPEPKYAGHCAFRGLAYYPEGQPYKPRVNYIYGRGLRAGFVPVSPTKVYWFICYNSDSPGPKITDPKELKRQALDLVKNWPSELPDTINITPEETISRAALEDRWLWPGLTPPVSKGGVVLVGDAWHPMTPNLGQGGCCALEDSVVLAKNLSNAIRTQGSIQDALRSYEGERWPRIFPLTIRANLVGGLLQWENPVICSLRNGFVIPKIVQLKPLLEHTNFACEPL
ncbi:monooxygenase 2-like [Silene latifolia]|uniref:monooxygenase 2-like n=1 Tax=Silene latifolia TaxID=37657 RepID=UPI003D774C28